ncbi:GIY-YIG nuclease family protein, partial [Bacillus sp. JJ722]|uniref:GIY-YIG nuclease family protein n=1 Tax=Bacillus sp. JJ722 TaxID=3122973 RepID=UPI002FFF55B1
MNKKYDSIVLNILDNGSLDLSHISKTVEYMLSNRDVVYVYDGEKNIYIGQTKNLIKRHKQHNKKEDNLTKFNRLIILYGQLVDKN